MRLLLSSHGANLYGAERVLLALAEGFASRGHQVTLEVPHHGPIDASVPRTHGVEVVYSGRPKPPSGAGRALRYGLGAPYHVHRLRGLIESSGAEVVWVNSLVNPLAAFAARLARVPVVWHLHECSFPGAVGRMAERVVGRAELPLFVSRYVAASYPHLVRTGHGRVLPNALFDGPEATPLPDREDLTVGYVGQLKPRKRPHELIEALALVDGVRAVLVGDGPYRPSIEASVARLGLEERVSLRGFLPDVRSFYAEVDCVVIPSVDEPFGLVALEAMAAGRPIVAANSGALPEVLEDAALYYTPSAVGELARQLDRLRREPALRHRLRARGLERVSFYSRERWLAQAEEHARKVAVPGKNGRTNDASRD